MDVSDVVQTLTLEQIKPTTDPLKGWTIEVARVFVDGGTVRFRDDTGGKPTATDGDVLNDGDYWNIVWASVSHFKVIGLNGIAKVNITPSYKFGS
jgi:hypothetical protein